MWPYFYCLGRSKGVIENTSVPIYYNCKTIISILLILSKPCLWFLDHLYLKMQDVFHVTLILLTKGCICHCIVTQFMKITIACHFNIYQATIKLTIFKKKNIRISSSEVTKKSKDNTYNTSRKRWAVTESPNREYFLVKEAIEAFDEYPQNKKMEIQLLVSYCILRDGTHWMI